MDNFVFALANAAGGLPNQVIQLSHDHMSDDEEEEVYDVRIEYQQRVKYWFDVANDETDNERPGVMKWYNQIISDTPFDATGLDMEPSFAADMTVLMMAANLGNLHICKWLLEHGADPNARDMFCKSALCYATSYPAIVKCLLKHGANPNILDEDGEAPIHRAKDPVVCQMLLDAGAVPDLMGRGYTALQSSAGGVFANKERVAQLLAAGADARRIGTGRVFVDISDDIRAMQDEYLAMYASAGGYREWLDATHPGSIAKWSIVCDLNLD